MNTANQNTCSPCQAFVDVGISEAKALAAAESVAEVIATPPGEMATKGDIAELRASMLTETLARIDDSRAETMARISKMEEKADESRAQTMARIDKMEEKVDDVRTEMLARIDKLDDKVDNVYTKISQVEVDTANRINKATAILIAAMAVFTTLIVFFLQ